jgi:hypothetical protein
MGSYNAPWDHNIHGNSELRLVEGDGGSINSLYVPFEGKSLHTVATPPRNSREQVYSMEDSEHSCW